MRVNTDACIRALEAAYEEAINQFVEAAATICREGLSIAHQHRGTSAAPRVYQHHTHNLANAPGYCIVVDGEIKRMEVYGDDAYPDAKQSTIELLTSSHKDAYGIYIADGMFYASFVSAKGFDVLDSCRAYLRQRFK